MIPTYCINAHILSRLISIVINDPHLLYGIYKVG